MNESPDRMDETIHNINFDGVTDLEWDSYIRALFNADE